MTYFCFEWSRRSVCGNCSVASSLQLAARFRLFYVLLCVVVLIHHCSCNFAYTKNVRYTLNFITGKQINSLKRLFFPLSDTFYVTYYILWYRQWRKKYSSITLYKKNFKALLIAYLREIIIGICYLYKKITWLYVSKGWSVDWRLLRENKRVSALHLVATLSV